MPNKTSYEDINLGPADTSYLFKLTQNHVSNPLAWAPHAAAVIWLAERTGAFKRIYNQLPNALIGAMCSDGISIYPSREYYDVLKYTASCNYGHLFAYAGNAGCANALEGCRDFIINRTRTELHTTMMRFRDAFRNGPQAVPNSLYAETAKTINFLFRGAFAPTAMVMAFDAMKIKHIIKCPALSKVIGMIEEKDRKSIEHNILSKLPADYDQLEDALVRTFEGICANAWSDDTREHNLEQFHDEYTSPVWDIVL